MNNPLQEKVPISIGILLDVADVLKRIIHADGVTHGKTTDIRSALQAELDEYNQAKALKAAEENKNASGETPSNGEVVSDPVIAP